MMKNLLAKFTAVLCISANTLFSQPTNLYLEQWTGNDPNEWLTFNFLMQLGSAQSTFKETANPGEGTASAKMVTVACAACPNFGLPDPAPGIIALSADPANFGVGMPYTQKPVSVSFLYKSNPMVNDAGGVLIQLQHYDANLDSTIVDAQGIFTESAVVTNWTSTTLPFQYITNDTPDTLVIIAGSSAGALFGPSFGTTATGSEFYIDSITIFDPCDGFSVSISTTDESAPTANDGTATATITGGTSAFSYAWSNTAQTTETITGLDGGVYTVTVTDDIGCIATASGTVNTVGCTGFSVSVSGTNQTSVGNNNGTAFVTASGGTSPYTYLWNTSPAQTTDTITGLAPGTYDVTVTDNIGCTAFGSYTVQAFVCNFSILVSGTNETAPGANDGTASVSNLSGGSSPYTYLWNTSPAQTTDTITGLAPGTYDVTVTDNIGCTAFGSYTVLAFVCNLSASATKTNETVAGANDGTATVTASGGTTPYTYNWNNGETTAAIDSLPPVNYSVTVTDANNCTATASVIIVAGSVGINNLNSTSLITVFPNPASNNISFSITDKNADRIVIIDVTGKVINNIRVANSFINISVATYPEGMYFYQVTGKNSGNISTGKFSVVK